MGRYFEGQKAGRVVFLLAMTALMVFIDALAEDKAKVWAYMAILCIAIAMTPTK